MPESRGVERPIRFLLKADVFSKDVLETWIEYKREKEDVRLRPHPMEFQLYYDV